MFFLLECILIDIMSEQYFYNLFALLQHFIMNIPEELKDVEFARKFVSKFYKEHSWELQFKDVKLARKFYMEVTWRTSIPGC